MCFAHVRKYKTKKIATFKFILPFSQLLLNEDTFICTKRTKKINKKIIIVHIHIKDYISLISNMSHDVDNSNES